MVPSSCRFFSFSLIFTVMLVVWYVASYYHRRLPLPVKTISPNSDRFVAASAKKYLDQLTNFGPRPVGSYENHVQAVQLLVTKLQKIKELANSSRVNFDIDIQRLHPGSFHLQIVGAGLTQHYNGIQNVIARLSPKTDKVGRRPAILMNCHFDSVPMGPGASDDGVSCAIMLEIIRVIMNSNKVVLTNDIILLFNGAEETVLQASHGFITQHPWAEDCKVFVNLEAAGSGGRELLFQTGPGQTWLIEAYIRSAPFPFASVVGQEIFQSGIIPSDTDFRIFRDFGNMSGLDIAFIKNGWVYHTEHDTSDRIELGCIQRAGDNVLSLLLRLLRRRNLVNVNMDITSTSTPVFFDLLGIKMISYPAWVGVVINLLVISVSMWAAHYDLNMFSKKIDVECSLLMKVVVVFITSEFITLVLAVVINAISGVMLDILSYSMTWYSRPYLLFYLYSLPTIGLVLIVYKWTLNYVTNWPKLESSDYMIEMSTFHAINLISAFIIMVMSLFGLKSAAMFSLPLVSSLLWWGLVRLLLRNRRPKWSSFLLYLLIILLPITMWSYNVQLIFSIFVPIMGRRGSSGNPDIILGVATAVSTILLLHYFLPLLVSLRRQVIVKSIIILSYIFTILYIIFGGGFPYTGNLEHPAQKRLSIFHTSRTVIDYGGKINKTDGGSLLGRWDHHWSSQLISEVPEYKSASKVDKIKCDELLGCGVPLHRHNVKSPVDSLWLPTSTPPQLAIPTGLSIVSRTPGPRDGTTNITLKMSGPSRVVLLMSPEPYVRLLEWSMTSGLPPTVGTWGERDVYMIQFVRGMEPGTQLFWMVMSGCQENKPVLTATISGHHDSGPDMIGSEFSQFLVKHPDWLSLAAWTVDYKYIVL